MQEFTAILMLKDKQGVVERELCSVRVEKHGELLSGINAVASDCGEVVCMFVSVDGDLEDWEFQAIYDYYDETVFDGLGLTVIERQGGENPEWEIRFPYFEDEERLSAKLSGILNLHRRELDSVREAIKDVKGDYGAV